MSGKLKLGVCLVAAILYCEVTWAPKADIEVSLAFWVTAAWIVGSLLISYLAQRFLMPKPKSFVQDDSPTVLATRGSPIPRVVGRRRIPYVFAWAGDREKRKEGGGKKGGGSEPEQDIFYESGWHILCLGPGQQLIEIEEGGKSIFFGPITPVSHPSGTTVDLGRDGSFKIYWGEEDQPIDGFLSDPNRIGVASRWPGIMHVVWVSKRLGPSPHWQQINYTVKVGLKDSTHLTQSEPEIEATVSTLNGPLFDIFDVVNGVEGVGNFQVVGNSLSPAYLFPGVRFRVTGNSGIPDQDFLAVNVTHQWVLGQLTSTVYPEGGLTGADPDGQIQELQSVEKGGVNPAHFLADLWFSPAPWGLAQDKSQFDLQSFEDLGILFAQEDLRGSFLGDNAITVKDWLDKIHADLGVILPFDRTTGLLKYVAIREPQGDLPHLSEDMQVGRLPEIANMIGSRPTDRVVWSFSSRKNRYRIMTITLDDAGQAAFAEFFRASTQEIVITVEFPTADKIAQRRELGDFGVSGALEIMSNRAARTLLPGTAFTADGFEEVLRLISVKSEPLSSQVALTAQPDIWGAAASEFLNSEPETESSLLPVVPDVQFQPIELPEFLVPGGPQKVLVARIRAHAQVEGSSLHISRDDLTYSAQGRDISIMQGGALLESIPVDDLWEIDQGPTITALGPDINSVLDLSSDLVSWRRGRQVVAINGELFFLKKVTSLGGDTYRLDGLIRARYDTRPEAHGVGDSVFIMQDDDGLTFDDVLIEPEVLLYVKSQPDGNGVWPLSLVEPETVDLYGKGVRPIPVSEIRFDTLLETAGVSHRSWQPTGGTDDLPITWGYFTPRSLGTGAGFFGAGVATSPAAAEGGFLVEILDDMGALVRSETVASNSYTYAESDRTSDFGGEPNLFQVRVTQLRGGLLADPVTETFTKVN